MPNPEKDGAGYGEEDKREAIALQVPGADPPTLEKEEVGVPEKRTCCSVVPSSRVPMPVPVLEALYVWAGGRGLVCACMWAFAVRSMESIDAMVDQGH